MNKKDMKAIEDIQRICDKIGCKVSFVNKSDDKAVKKEFKEICSDIEKKENK